MGSNSLDRERDGTSLVAHAANIGPTPVVIPMEEFRSASYKGPFLFCHPLGVRGGVASPGSHPAARSASSEKKLSGRGELRQPHERELGRADFPWPIQVHVTEPAKAFADVGKRTDPRLKFVPRAEGGDNTSSR
jgi:hypothetical protein